MQHNAPKLAALALVFLSGFMLGVPCGRVLATLDWQQEAASRNVARYDARTGKWQWLQEKSEADDDN